jgi:hypothetical protein
MTVESNEGDVTLVVEWGESEFHMEEADGGGRYSKNSRE